MSSSSTDDFPQMQEIMLEFRAGKMHFEGKRVIPDPHKGLVRIARGEEGLVHFQWLDRTQNAVENDQIIFPHEAVFEKVNQASGRVYILKFSSDDRKFFFWMQEPKAEDDSQLCSSVNYYINRPLKFPGDEEPDSSDPLQVSEDMNEDEISSRAGALIGSNLSAEGISEVTSSSGPVKLEDLQRILSNIEPSGVAEDLDEGRGMFVLYETIENRLPQIRSLKNGLVHVHCHVCFGLGDMFRPDLIMPFFETLPLEQRLACYLPEGQWSPEYILELLQSPQFRQQVDSFTYVLRTGQIDLSQFEIDPSKYKFTVLSFLEALEDSVSNMSDSGEATQENEDLRSQSCNPNDTMDKSQ